MSLYLAIALGGSFGAVCRYWVSNSANAWLGTGFPYGTMIVNISGSFVMGFLVILLTQKLVMPEAVRLALIVGFLGSYTTFSTFALDSLNTFNSGAMIKLTVYILMSVFGSILGVWLGNLAARLLTRS